MDDVLVPHAAAFDEALAAVEAAARDFAHPDPAVRTRGERVFLAVGQAEQAVDFACFFLARSADAFVLFQSLGMILGALPGIAPAQAYPVSPHVPSLSALSAFLARLSVHRASALSPASSAAASTSAPTPTPAPAAPTSTASAPPPASSTASASPAAAWPAYVQRRAFQTIAATGKKALAVDLALASQQTPPTSLAAVAEQHANHLLHFLSSLLQPTANNSPALGPAADMAWLALGLVHATIDEYSLSTASSADSDSEATSGRGDADKGKARAVEKGSRVGLTASMHILCKAAFEVRHIRLSLWALDLPN